MWQSGEDERRDEARKRQAVVVSLCGESNGRLERFAKNNRPLSIAHVEAIKHF